MCWVLLHVTMFAAAFVGSYLLAEYLGKRK